MYQNKKSLIIYKDWIDELNNMSSLVTRAEALNALCEYGFTGVYTANPDPYVNNFIQKCMPKLQRDFNNYATYMQKHGLNI